MGKNILLCDGSAFIRMMVKDILERNGYTVAGTAGNGVEVVEKVQALKPDLTLMDVAMPELDSVQALKRIKSQCPDAVVLMMASEKQRKLIVECIQAGAVSFVTKPIQKEELLTEIKKVCG